MWSLTRKKKQSIETDSEITEMLEVTDDRAVINIMFKYMKKDMNM